MKKYLYYLKPFPMKHIQLLFFALLLFFQNNEIAAQCNPDITPPVAICDIGLVATLDQNGQVALWASDFDDGSYDACSAVDLYIEEGLPPSPNPPATQSLDFDTSDVGMHDIVLWVIDQAGNSNSCIIALEITDCQSNPSLACYDDVIVVLDSTGAASILPEMILAGGPFCYFDMGIDFDPSNGGGGFPGLPALNVDTTDIGTQIVLIYDSQAGNSCWGSVIIQPFPFYCFPDVTPPVPYCKTGLTASLDANGDLTIWAQDFDAGSFDLCTAIDFFIEEGLPPSPNPPATQSLDFDSTDIGLHNIVMWVVDQAGNSDYCTVLLEIDSCQGSNNLACNNQVFVSLSQNGTASILPDWILEGGPYCSTYGIDFANSSGSPGLPALNVDTTDIGSQIVVVYDTQTGNACWGTVIIQNVLGGSCSPDVTPPVAICDTFTVVTLNLGAGTATVPAQVFDNGSYDNCSSVEFFAEKGLPPSSTPPAGHNITFGLPDIGINDVVLWVVDQAGNDSYCLLSVEVKGCNGTSSLACAGNITVGIPPSGSIDIDPSFTQQGGPYCSPLGIYLSNVGSPPGTPFITLDTSHIGTTQAVVIYDPSTGLSCWSQVEVIDCQNDTTIPVAVCQLGILVEMGKAVPHEVTIWGTDFDAGSYDNCSVLDWRMELGAAPSSQAPSTQSLTFDESQIGVFDVVMWVIDGVGNESYCSSTLEIIAPNCNNDTSPPICTAPANTSISQSAFNILGIDPQDDAQLSMYFGFADADDNCGVGGILKSVSVVDGNQCGLSKITRTFVAYDSTGNLSQPCHQIIDVYNDWEIRLPQDFLPGDPFIDSMEIISSNGGLLAVTFEDIVFDADCDGNADKILRKWTAINWCDLNPNTSPASIDRLDLDADGKVGDGFNVRNGQDSIYLLENGLPTTGLDETSWGVEYFQIIRLNYNDTLHFTLNGTVYHDGNNDCSLDSMESTLEGWPVLVTGLNTGDTQSTFTDSLGQYSFNLCTIDTLVEVSLDVPFNYGTVCGTTHTVQFAPGVTQTVVQDIPLSYDTLCPILWVDISTPFLRRCFNNYYTVNYCNYSDATIEDVYVEVQLDPFMTFTSSGLSGTSLGGNLYSFDLGNMAAGECGDFKIFFDLECSATLGATHCVDAHIYPDTLCPNPVNWSGANIEVEALCENDTVFLSLKNTGNSAMAGPLGYIVVEDVVMLTGDNFNLGSGEIHALTPIPATGSTYRIEAPQEPGHPYPGIVAKAVEGCNGINIFGLVNLFTLENANPFIASDCQQNIGSFDPNDKQAFPAGYGNEHFIERNTDIDYLIRFQNTGTDTAFKVAIIDELDPSLDPASVRPGAASHDYQFELIDGNTLRFTFHDIMLPDSNLNEPASHGFVKFKASQKADLPLGTVIENEAAIYFDFNDPVITNNVFHTLGEHFIDVINDTNERPAGLGNLLTYPNPSFGDVTFKIPTTASVEAVFILHDALGKQLVVEPFTATNTYRFERGELAPGVYFYKVKVEGLGRYTGKVILQ